jgi:hypothetical protein
MAGKDGDPKNAKPAHPPMDRYHVPGDETKVSVGSFRLRRVNHCIVIESLNPRLVDHEGLRKAFAEATAKPDRIGVVINFPTPTYVTSLVIVAIRELARQAHADGIPFMGVFHPKLRLLLRIFELQDEVPSEARLDLALRVLNEKWGGGTTG